MRRRVQPTWSCRRVTQVPPQSRSRRRLGWLLVVVHVGFAAVLVGWVLVRLVAVGEGRVVVLVLVAGGQMGPVLAAAQIVGHMGVLVVVDFGVVAVLLPHGQTLLSPDDRPVLCSAVAGVAVITAVGVAVAAGVGGIAVVAAVAVRVRGVG